jgi:hypothetical protein
LNFVPLPASVVYRLTSHVTRAMLDFQVRQIFVINFNICVIREIYTIQVLTFIVHVMMLNGKGGGVGYAVIDDGNIFVLYRNVLYHAVVLTRQSLTLFFIVIFIINSELV